MEFVEVGSVKDGDRIRWHLPSGVIGECRVSRVRGWGHSQTYDAPFVDFIEENGPFRFMALPFITHLNGRRVDRSYWAGRLPDLDLQGQPEERESGNAVQILFPLTEEDVELAALKTSTRKSLDEMSESHRAHVEKWEPHVENLGAEHVWVSANRFSGRGEGPVYVGIKRGSKDYAIVDYDTDKMPKVNKSKVLEDGFESSKALLEAFKEYRAMAKAERAENKATKKPAAKKETKKASAASAKKPAAKKPAAKKAPARKRAPKK